MRKTVSVYALILVVALLFGSWRSVSAGQPGVPQPFPLNGTTWAGTVTFVSTDGTTEEATDATFVFKTQADYYVSGTFTATEGLTTPLEMDFSGTVGTIPRKAIHLTAVDFVMSGEVVRMGHGKAMKMGIRGNDVLTGRTFMGWITKQASQ